MSKAIIPNNPSNEAPANTALTAVEKKLKFAARVRTGLAVGGLAAGCVLGLNSLDAREHGADALLVAGVASVGATLVRRNGEQGALNIANDYSGKNYAGPQSKIVKSSDILAGAPAVLGYVAAVSPSIERVVNGMPIDGSIVSAALFAVGAVVAAIPSLEPGGSIGDYTRMLDNADKTNV